MLCVPGRQLLISALITVARSAALGGRFVHQQVGRFFMPKRRAAFLIAT